MSCPDTQFKIGDILDSIHTSPHGPLGIADDFEYEDRRSLDQCKFATLWTAWQRYGFTVDDEADIVGLRVVRRYGDITFHRGKTFTTSVHGTTLTHSFVYILAGQAMTISNDTDRLVLTDLPNMNENMTRSFTVFASSERAATVLANTFALFV